MQKLLKYLLYKKSALKKNFLPLHEPDISKLDQKEITKIIKSGFVSSVGKDIQRFENIISKFTNSKFVITTINGTAAIHIGLKLLGVKKGDEVLLPSIGFVAASNSIIYNNAEPHFVDSELNHFGVDPDKLKEYLKKNTYISNNKCINKKTKKIIKAIIIVHVFGHPAKISEIIKIAKKYKIKVLEDAAESLGSKYKGKHVGNFGDIGILSFNGNKIVTTGSGGAILCNNRYLAKKARHLVTTSKLKHKWEFIHDDVGYNYRLANLNAALGISQIKRVNKFIKKKHEIYKRFNKLIDNSKDLFLLNQPKSCRSNFWLQTLVLKKPSVHLRNKILTIFYKKKILARPIWKPLHKLNFLTKYQKMSLKNAEQIEKKIINIPSSCYL